MANSARHHLPLFTLLVHSSDDQKSALLKTLTPVQLKAVLEAIVNVLRGYCPLNDKEKKTLIKHKDIIRRMVSKELTRMQQQRLLNKHRTILPQILRPVIAFLSQFE